jgi:hypothetical protein
MRKIQIACKMEKGIKLKTFSFCEHDLYTSDTVNKTGNESDASMDTDKLILFFYYAHV